MKTNLIGPFLLITACLCLAGCGPPIASIAYTFTSLDVPVALSGDVPLAMTRALGINDSDVIVGTYLVQTGFVRDFHGFLRAPTTQQYSQIDFLGNDTNRNEIFSYKINNRGDIIGTRAGASVLREGVAVDPLVVPFPNVIETQALGMLVAGRDNIIVGRYRDNNVTHGFLGVGGFHTYDPAIRSGDATTPTAVNKDGAVVGFIGGTGEGGPGPGGTEPGFTRIQGFLSNLDGRNLTTIDPPFSIHTEFWGINNAGLVVGWYTEASRDHRTFGLVRQLDGTLAQVSFPFSKNTWIYGVNSLGHIVGMFEDDVPPNLHGFLGIPK